VLQCVSPHVFAVWVAVWAAVWAALCETTVQDV